MAERYDVVVIGAGPAGYVAAIRCAQLGLNTACVDQWLSRAGKPVLGGTCLNAGCIPSKALLESSERYAETRDALAAHGIKVAGVELDLHAMMARKDKVVEELTEGIAQLFKSNRVSWIQGHAQLHANREVRISESATNSERTLQAGYVILAPGSSAVQLDSAPLHEDIVVDSTGALEFSEVPQRLGVIGAGVIGLELGSVWRRLGSQTVTLLEAQECFLPIADEMVAREALRVFSGQGLNIQLGSRVMSSEVSDGVVRIRYQNAEGDHEAEFDKLIVAVGPLT